MGRGVCKGNVARAAAALKADPESIGAKLGVLVYASNVPACTVAFFLRVSLPTVYRWFYCVNDVDPPFRKRVAKMTAILEQAMEDGTLPATGDLSHRSQALIEVMQASVAKA